jgi:ribosomal RNA-processing protein 36
MEGAEEEDTEDEEEDDSEDDDDMSNEASARHKISTVSFGALAKAQAAMPPDRPTKRARGDDGDEARLEALRARLRELRGARAEDAVPSKRAASSGPKGIVHDDSSSENDGDGGHDGEEEGGRTTGAKKRASKHAPAERSSKKPVSRRRTVIDAPKSRVRDPRFDSALGGVNHEQVRRNYKFVDDVVDAEIGTLRKQLKDQKALSAAPGPRGKKRGKKKVKGVERLDERELEELKRELNRKESRKAAQAARDREGEVRREHRRGERESVAEGKRPFFLKRSEVREEVVKRRFGEVGEGKRERMMERRRKKVAGKERKMMPAARRAAGE